MPKPKKRPRLKLLSLLVIAGLLLVETISTAILAKRPHLPNFNPAIHFFLGRLFVTPQPPPIPLGHQRDIGRLNFWCAGYDRDQVPDPLLGSRMAKNIVATNANGWGWIITNPQGFTSTGKGDFFFNPDKPKGTFRIIMLGGSTMRGIAVNSPVDNLPAQVERALAGSGLLGNGEKLEVINAGVNAYYSTNELSYLKAELLRFEPDLVIAYDGWNDYTSWVKAALDGVEEVPAPALASQKNFAALADQAVTVPGALGILGGVLRARLRCVGETLIHRSAALALFRLWRHEPPRSFYADFLPVEALAHLDPKLASFSPEKVISVLEDNWDELVYLSRKRHFRLAVFLQPIMGVDERPPVGLQESTIARLDGPQFPSRRFYYAAARRSLERLGKEHTVCTGDLSGIFRGIRTPLYSDSGHLREDGNRIVAQAMVERLVACDSLSQDGAARP